MSKNQKLYFGPKSREKKAKNCKAVKIHPTSKGLAIPTNLFTPEHFRGAVYEGTIHRDLYGKAFILSTFKPLQELENDVSQPL